MLDVPFTNKTVFGLLQVIILFTITIDANAQVTMDNNRLANSDIDLVEMEYRLIPLTQDDLNEVADYWMLKLKEHLLRVSEIQIKSAQAEGEQKAELLQSLNKHYEQSTLLKDRVKLVLTELQKKGGDISQYQSYIKAVSTPKVDTKDSSALATAVIGWLQSPEGGMRWTQNIALFLITLFVFWALASFFGGLTEKAVNKLENTSDLLKEFFVHLVQNLTKIIGVMIALSMLEVNIGPLLAAFGAAGFIIGFALQGTLSNFASGLMILIYRPYDLGNVVNVAGTTGTVDSMTLVSTTLKLPDNQVVVIPNNAIWGSTITNISGSETRRVDMVFGIGYDDDIQKAERVLREIIGKHPLVLAEPETVIKVHELADSSVNFIVRPWVKTADYFAVYWDVTRSVKEQFDAQGLSIPYPQQDVHVYNQKE